MYYILYNVFFALKRLERRIGKRGFSKLCRKYYDAFDIYLNVVFREFMIKFPSRKSGITKKKRQRKVIVSLTSFPARIETVWLTIETIFRQSVKADEVILWLAESQFDGFDSLPASLKRMCGRGLTIRFCDDLRSHKKYYYAFQEYSDELVVLMDDDTFYPRNVIKQLLKLHKKYPNDIISMLSQQVPYTLGAMPSTWTSISTPMVSSQWIQPFTGQGTLFQPSQLNNILYDKQLIKTLAPYADDLWLYIVSFISGQKVTAVWPRKSFSDIIWGTGANALLNINTANGENYNDIQWKKIIKYFEMDV